MTTVQRSSNIILQSNGRSLSSCEPGIVQLWRRCRDASFESVCSWAVHAVGDKVMVTVFVTAVEETVATTEDANSICRGANRRPRTGTEIVGGGRLNGARSPQAPTTLDASFRRPRPTRSSSQLSARLARSLLQLFRHYYCVVGDYPSLNPFI
jgi:hypothetical protein